MNAEKHPVELALPVTIKPSIFYYLLIAGVALFTVIVGLEWHVAQIASIGENIAAGILVILGTVATICMASANFKIELSEKTFSASYGFTTKKVIPLTDIKTASFEEKGTGRGGGIEVITIGFVDANKKPLRIALTLYSVHDVEKIVQFMSRVDKRASCRSGFGMRWFKFFLRFNHALFFIFFAVIFIVFIAVMHDDVFLHLTK